MLERPDPSQKSSIRLRHALELLHNRHVAELGNQLARAGQFADPVRLTPTYIRKPEAEEKFEAARK